MKYEDLIEETIEVLETVTNFEGRHLLEEFYRRHALFTRAQTQIIALDELMQRQYDLQEKMGWPNGFGVAGFKENMLAVHAEASEALDEIPWKNWKPVGYKEVDKDAVATELMDIVQFIANAALCLDITAAELSTALRKKYVENERRVSAGEVTTSKEKSDV